MAEANDVMGMLAAIGHEAIDDVRGLRAALRNWPEEEDPAPATEILRMTVKIGEGLIADMMQLGESPEGAPALLPVLTVVVPLALRVALVRAELSDSDEGMNLYAVEDLVQRVVACLDQQPAHGRGWAIVALWLRLSEEEDAEPTKLATHFGTGDFLEGEWLRVEMDLGLTQDAG